MEANKPKRTPKMPIMEVFGPTIQGEGMVIGQKTMFIRTGGCDYSCSWCDSAFTWNGEQKAEMLTGQEVWDRVEAIGSRIVEGKKVLNFNHITISGGNPALIGQAMADLIDIAKSHGVRFGLETQGTKWQDWFMAIDDLTISPKPPSSGMVTNYEKLFDIMHKLMENALFTDFSVKVVIFDDKDFEYAKDMYKQLRDRKLLYEGDFYVSVGNEDAKEEGQIAGRLLDKLDWLWNKVIEDPDCNDWKPLPQLHTLVWDNKRGV